MCQTAHHPLQAIGPVPRAPVLRGPVPPSFGHVAMVPGLLNVPPRKRDKRASNTPASHTYFPVGQITTSTCGTNGENQDRIWAGPMVMDGLLTED